jgi:alpha-galactosidase
MRILLSLVLAASVCLAGPGDPSYYVKKATWHETVRASQEALEKEVTASLGNLGVRPGRWFVAGPFKGADAFARPFPPESGVDLNASYENGTLRWQARVDWRDGQVIMFDAGDSVARYLVRTLKAAKDTTIKAYLGSDDGIKVWLGDSIILAHDISRGCRRNQEIVALPLKRGDNTVLMKVINGDGPTGFYFSLVDLDPEGIWQLVGRDFASLRETREISWEREDGIWDKEWEHGGYRELAGRYAIAYRNIGKRLGETTDLLAGDVVDARGLARVRAAYLAMRDKEVKMRREEMKKLTVTPKPSPRPRINGAKVFGVRPGSPFFYTVPVTGRRPIQFEAAGLPEGLTLDSKSGRITGELRRRGEYHVTLKATNALGAAERQFKIVVGDHIALTPPLGWNSWNCFATDVDDGKIRAAADAMVKSGLINHGWTYINIDDCWMTNPDSRDPVLSGRARDEHGMINSNGKFPDMKALSDYVHGKGLRLGIYSSPGPLTCAGFTASYQHEVQDARRFAEWGIDYLKYDWCSYGGIATDNSLPSLKKPYLIMREALSRVKRDIVYSLCQYGMGDVWEWGEELGGNCWRTTGDITDTWKSMSGIGFNQAGHEKHAGPGHWNDPDMLVVGWVGWGPQLHPSGLTPHEQVTHLSLWSLLCSPLLIGCDMTKLDDFTLSLLTNDEVLDVNQDPLGKQAARVSKEGDLEVWAKAMEDGSMAVGLFNRGDRQSMVAAKWADLGLTGRHRVRDLWRQRNVGVYEKEVSFSVARHGAVLVRISKPQ